MKLWIGKEDLMMVYCHTRTALHKEMVDDKSFVQFFGYKQRKIE